LPPPDPFISILSRSSRGLPGGEEWPDPEFAEFRFIFQKRGDRAIAMGRYDNGWFAGVRAKNQ